MKPHRVRMAHNLISAYGMLDKMTVLVGFCVVYTFRTYGCI